MRIFIICTLSVLFFSGILVAGAPERRQPVHLLSNNSDTNKNYIPQANAASSAPADLNNTEYKTGTHFKLAILLDIPVEEVNNVVLYEFIADWYRTRYLYGGTSKKGVDCSAFTQRLVKDVYHVDIDRIVGDQYRQCKPVAKAELKQGDLIFFHTTRAGLSHVGFYLGNNKFIHSGCSKGVFIEDLRNSYYARAYRTAGRFLND